MEYLNELNKNQLEAVKHMDGPCLVLAGAGSGKTKVLTTRIAHLINEGIPSNNILAITFTNKAAEEMKDRVGSLVYNNYSFVGTFHSFGLKIIKENYKHLNLNSNFTILDSDDTMSVIKRIMKDLNIDGKDVAPRYIQNKISFIKNEMLNDLEIEKFFNTYVDNLVKDVYFRYVKLLERNNSLDFDDLLKKPVELFKHNLDILNNYQEKYKYILIDEYQDTNKLQYELVKMLSEKYQNIFAVGDANQSIYAFRGANYKNILNFERDFKNALVIKLDKNYRSTNTILSAATNVIKNNESKYLVDLHSDLGKGVNIIYRRNSNDLHEVENVARKIKKLLNVGYNKRDIAIFYRTNAQSRLIEESMNKHSLSYKIVGNIHFYKRKEIKDLISYLKLISNPFDDVALERIINTPRRGIGAVTLNNLKNMANEHNKSILEVIESGKELEFKTIINYLINIKEDLSLTELIDEVLEKSGYIESLENDKTLESNLRIENLMEFKSITKTFESDTGTVDLNDFLEQISLVSDVSEYEEENDLITLMTIHASKGLEYKVVFLVGLEESIFPHFNSLNNELDLEEERRLCYVAITRAKEKLYISNAEKRMLFGNTVMNLPSRFITEINKNYLDVIDESSIVPKINKDKFYTKDNKEFNIGDTIMHQVFGRGKVIDIRERIYLIEFHKKHGEKQVLKNYKGMNKI